MKCLPHKQEDLSLILTNDMKTQECEVACDPSAGVETGSFLSHWPEPLNLLSELQASKRLSQKGGGRCLRDDPRGCPLFSTHAQLPFHEYIHIYTQIASLL